MLVLDGVQDPHNLGACLRSAAAAGVTAVIIPKDKAVQVNATVRKTSAGAADSIPVIRATNLARCLRDLQQLGVWIYGLAGEAEASLYSIDLQGQRRAGAGRRSRRPAPADARALRPAGEDPDAGRHRKPQCVGGHRRDPVRSGAATRKPDPQFDQTRS